jgi:predicted nuclease of predicted toxin-antitoxin system
MLRLATDADINGVALRALLRRQPDLDLVRIQDFGLRSAPDPEVLDGAASEGRILITHDRTNMTRCAYEQIRAGLPTPGVYIIRDRHHEIGRMVEDILLVALCSRQEEWEDRVEFLPLA